MTTKVSKVNTLITKLGDPSTWGRESRFGIPDGIVVKGSRWAGWADHKNEQQGYTAPLYDEAQLKKLAEMMISEFQDILTSNRGEDTGTLSYRIEDHFKE